MVRVPVQGDEGRPGVKGEAGERGDPGPLVRPVSHLRLPVKEVRRL